MKWNVTAADRETGKETILPVEADNEVAARKTATDRGFLVAGIKQAGVPDYELIVSGAKLVGVLSGILKALSAVMIVIAFISLMAYVADSRHDVAISVFAGSVVSSIGLFVVGAMLAMASSLALAVRDVAINSFRRL